MAQKRTPFQYSAAMEFEEGPHGDRRRYYELTGSGEQALRHEVQRLREVVELSQFRALLSSGQEG